MDAGLITGIINGATSLASSFVAFGGQVYAVDHTKLPSPDNYSYNIVLPPPQKQALNTETIVLIVILVIILLTLGFALYKFS